MLLEKTKPREGTQPHVPDDLKGTRAGLFYLLSSKHESGPQQNRSPMRQAATPKPAVSPSQKQDAQILLEDDNFLFKTR